ncbi:hypothetical protein FA15DRAFT_668917 [Coprinopsis marcescibilis]|uniref:NAD(P)-binding protein n=1 Tax=Coprinopsis marcescibilis TaxID=230819 RepID=A0A5C3KWJ6_COPMA|nr:hypothetical protein FA15DRAFT_668917 [Coprinopsis marcescibilis]
MADSQAKPSVLVFGGLNTCSRALAALLIPLDGEPLVSHLRIVDKYSVDPATTYIGPEFPHILKNKVVEYKQANLKVATTIAEVYEPPAGQAAFDYVFDFTGEIRDDRTDVIQYDSTYCVARLLGLEAAKRKVKAYVRIQQPFYETSSKSGDEKQDSKPVGSAGIWWHETLRGLGAIEDLNLVILRTGFIYGPYTNYGIIATGINVAAVYGYLKKPMKSIWSPGKNPNNTVHIDDVAGAAWTAATWVAATGRKAADEAAGEEIIFHNDKNKIKEFTNIVPPSQRVVAPLFNIVDDSNNTLLSVGQVVTSFFGTTFEFFNLVESTVIKVLDEVEDINEQHVGGWTRMLAESKPPITHTPLNAYMDKSALSKHTVGLNNAKIKKVLDYKLKRPEFNHDSIKEIVDKWKAEGIWPKLD